MSKSRKIIGGKNRFALAPYVILLLIAAFVIFSNGSFESINAWINNSAEVSAQTENSNFTVHYMDVGQADCTLILCGGETMLIDAGERETSGDVIKYLKDLGITELTYAVATHPHADHIGGMSDVIETFKVKNMLMPDAVNTTNVFKNLLGSIEKANLEITVPAPGDVFTLGTAKLTVLSPMEKEYDDLNNYSIALKAVYGDTSFLFMGDAETLVEKEILNAGYDIKSNVLKVSHHGSDSSSSVAFLKAVAPAHAVISCGKDNSYGHPHKDVIKRLEQMNVDFKITSQLGTITAISDGKVISFK